MLPPKKDREIGESGGKKEKENKRRQTCPIGLRKRGKILSKRK